MNKAINNIKESMLVGHPLIQIISFEEKRVENYLEKLCEQILKSGTVLYWDSIKGILKGDEVIADTTDPVKGLEYVQQINTPGIFIFRDLTPYLKDSQAVVRKLRDIYYSFKNTKRFVVLLSPDEYVHQNLKKEIEVMEFEVPDFKELENLFNRFLSKLQNSGKQINLTEEEVKKFVTGVQGLNIDEAYKAFKKVFSGRDVIGIELLSIIHEEKKRLILKEGVLEYYPHKFTLKDLGGLDKIKDWLQKRKNAFSKEAKEFGLDTPKGILCMGVSGCGKSLTAKVVASLWDLPLFRLDMNLVYSGVSGSPEIVFSRALKTMDSVAPAVLWIDEIESGITDKQGDGHSSRILGYFLTWMQEHDSQIFVAATANRIDLLPAELIRRGRFDQIFFIDLPTRKEREDIFKIHLERKDNEIKNFNIAQLAQITKGWSGSEIEQAIISSMYEAFNQNRKLEEDDLFITFGNSVPLSTTMEEQIKKVRSWAHDRASRSTTDREY